MSVTASKSMARPSPPLKLTDVEDKLARLLLAVAKSNKEHPSQLRFTGGWVRDKLLGVESKDVDIAIDNMTGMEFGLQLQQFLRDPPNAEKYGLGATPSVAISHGHDDQHSLRDSSILRDFGGLHKIVANPEKSKHLETVTTRIFGLDIDLVNLRKETYDEASRNPQMEFGEPEEDALRRDATVNALFYNLQTGLVEDLTGRGLYDMESKLIMTPMDPLRTFTDDPLRVLRLIRFASRLNYTIDNLVKKAMDDHSVKEALRIKISRERVGIEVDKMLHDEMNLYGTIFAQLDPAISSFSPDTTLWKSSYDLVQSLIKTEHQTKKLLVQDEFDHYMAWLLCALVPYSQAPLVEGAKKQMPLATLVVREGIKASNAVANVVTASFQNAEEILSTKDAATQALNSKRTDDDSLSRAALGMKIRKWGPSWRNQAFLALLLDADVAANSNRGTVTVCLRLRADFLREWSSFLELITNLTINRAYDFKPVMDGKQLCDALNMKPGPWVADALNVIMKWQLSHPEGASTNDALEAVSIWRDAMGKSNKSVTIPDKSEISGELTAALIHHFLQSTIRPHFSKTEKHHAETITAQGRQTRPSAIPSRGNGGLEDEATTRPWKTAANAHVLELLQWAVMALSPSITRAEWHLLLPPLLTLLDDTNTKYRTLGATLVHRLLLATPLELLELTGIGPVLETALSPSLHHLPTLTAEAESYSLLKATYTALLILYEIQFPNPPGQALAQYSQQPISTGKRKHKLSHLLHEHVIQSLGQISPGAGFPMAYPRLIGLLLEQVATIADRLGADVISQLVYLVPLFNEIFNDNMASLSADGSNCLGSAAIALTQVMESAWPRIWRWRGDIYLGLSRAWISVVEAETGEKNLGKDELAALALTKKALRTASSKLLQCCKSVLPADVDGAILGTDIDAMIGTQRLETTFDLTRELESLIEADQRLAKLFNDSQI